MTEKDYQNVLEAIENYLQKSSDFLSEEKKSELLRLSLAAETYEQATYPVPIPNKA
jgi:antitoxin component HigA of HigAB toxin-antitoxin module